jgi:hypothetical protein
VFCSSLVTRHSSLLFSAFLGRDREERSDLLLHLLALAFWAGHFTFVVLCQGHDHAERLIAFLAEIFVLGHRRSPPKLVNVILADNAAHKKDGSRQGAKAQRNARQGPVISFACFAALRETGLAVLMPVRVCDGLPQGRVPEPLS